MPDTESADPLRSTAREALELAEAAEAGPWGIQVSPPWQGCAAAYNLIVIATGYSPMLTEPNAAFQAAARTDVPTLARAVLSQADTIDELRAEVESLRARNEVLTARLTAAFVDSTHKRGSDDDGWP